MTGWQVASGVRNSAYIIDPCRPRLSHRLFISVPQCYHSFGRPSTMLWVTNVCLHVGILALAHAARQPPTLQRQTDKHVGGQVGNGRSTSMRRCRLHDHVSGLVAWYYRDTKLTTRDTSMSYLRVRGFNIYYKLSWLRDACVVVLLGMALADQEGKVVSNSKRENIFTVK